MVILLAKMDRENMAGVSVFHSDFSVHRAWIWKMEGVEPAAAHRSHYPDHLCDARLFFYGIYAACAADAPVSAGPVLVVPLGNGRVWEKSNSAGKCNEYFYADANRILFAGPHLPGKGRLREKGNYHRISDVLFD
jgi:hypothetical protein